MSGFVMVDNEIRDAVVKLEVKMEQMTTAISSMAVSVEKLADMKYEIKETKQEMEAKYQRYLMDYHKMTDEVSSIRKDVHAIAEKYRTLESKSEKNSWFVANASKLGWMVITAGIGFIIWIVQKSISE